jgi:hypothetical protein
MMAMSPARESSFRAGIRTHNLIISWADAFSPGNITRLPLITESNSEIKLSMKSADAAVSIEIEGGKALELPPSSIFSSLAEASAFFEAGSLGYSVTGEPDRLDGLRLETEEWRVGPLEVKRVFSSYFCDEGKFPKDSIEFDHALIMRDVQHQWHSADDLYV